MYKQSQYDSWVLEVANHLVKRYGYQMISLAQDSSQVWLVNPKNQTNPIIMVTSTRVDSFDYELIMTHRANLSMVLKSKPDGLNISVNQEVLEGNNVDVVVGPDYVSHPNLTSQFPDLKNILQISKNPETSRSRSVANLRKTLSKSQKKASYKLNPVTNIIGLILIVIFTLAQTLIITKDFNPGVVAVMLGAFYKPFIVDGHEWFRLVTGGFLHVDFLHLFMNLMALRGLGSMMEPVVGSKRFLFTLLAGIILGNAFVFVLDGSVIGLGISGGLFAILGLFVVHLFESGAIKNSQVYAQVIKIFAINLLISLLPTVSASAHLGGLIAGLLLGLMFSKRKDWNILRKGTTVLATAFCIAIIAIMTQRSTAIHNPIVDSTVINSWYEFGFERYASRLNRLLR